MIDENRFDEATQDLHNKIREDNKEAAIAIITNRDTPQTVLTAKDVMGYNALMLEIEKRHSGY